MGRSPPERGTSEGKRRALLEAWFISTSANGRRTCKQ